jgi:hypothetical protein
LSCGLAALKLLLFQTGLHKLTYILLAWGVAALTVPLVENWLRRIRLPARTAGIGLVGAVASLVCLAFGRELVWEYRARSGLPTAKPGAPNVLLIVLDTVRADALSLYGYYRNTSPELASLARQGVRFERAIATAPWTLNSHASMFTGQLYHQFGVAKLRPLDARFPTLAEVLSDQGFLTAGFVANSAFGHADYGLGRGFLHYEDIPVSALEILRAPQLGERLLKLIDVVRYKVSELLGDELLVRAFGDDPRVSLWGFRNRKNAAQINRDALDWISAQKGRPFFVFLNYL